MGTRHTATLVWPMCDIRRAKLSPGARSSAGQSSCLLSSGSRVRILPGALDKTAAQSTYCRADLRYSRALPRRRARCMPDGPLLDRFDSTAVRLLSASAMTYRRHHCRGGPWRPVCRMPHAVHQLAQVRTPVSRELITGVSQIMKVDHREPGHPQSRMSVATAEVTTQASGVPTLRRGSAASWTGSRSTTGVLPGGHLHARRCDSDRSPRRVHQVVHLQLGKATRRPRLVRVSSENPVEQRLAS